MPKSDMHYDQNKGLRERVKMCVKEKTTLATLFGMARTTEEELCTQR